MCGIVGSLNIKNQINYGKEHLYAMLGAIRHRGPDEFGTYIYQNDTSRIALGSARLSIIDLKSGQQPISNETKTIWIVFNGEIYNHIELREHVISQGHHVSTLTDTEIIIHLYEEYGYDCLNYLNGQFVFAIWDEKKQLLFIARDRLGIRPLHYTIQHGVLLFASEIKALLTNNRISTSIDLITLDQIFSYWSPLSPRTIFQNIKTLPPGSYLTARAGEEVSISQYWHLDFSPSDHRNKEEIKTQFRDLLIDATKIRLRADVDVGAYLSGGIDSSTIAAITQQYTNNRLETFSIGFTDENYDESSYQQHMTNHLGTNHHKMLCTYEDIGKIFPNVIWHTEIPIMRTSPAPMYLLSKHVHNHKFKVVLTGEGADEILAGYNIFKEAKIRRFWARQPDSELRPILLSRLYQFIGGFSQSNPEYLKKIFGWKLLNTNEPLYSHIIRWRSTSRCKRVFSSDVKNFLADHTHSPEEIIPIPNNFFQWSHLSQAQYLENKIFLTEYLLSSQGDRMALAHSIEGRYPFLDHRVVEFCNHLPDKYKLFGLNEKYLLKITFRDLLPKEIYSRNKRPYRAPIHKSFFSTKHQPGWVSEIISHENLTKVGLFEPQVITNLVRKINDYGYLNEIDDMMLSGILSTLLLYQQFYDDFCPNSPLNGNDRIKNIVR